MNNNAFGISDCDIHGGRFCCRRPWKSRHFNRLLLAAFALFIAGVPSVLAINASPERLELQQPGGAKITLHIRGDEYVHWLEDTAGYSVVFDGHQYVYAQPDSSGRLAATTFV